MAKLADRLEVRGLGEWTFNRTRREIEFTGCDGEYRLLSEHRLLDCSLFVDVWELPNSAGVLILDRRGNEVYVGYRSGDIERVLVLSKRDALDPGFFRASFIPTSPISLLVFENGVAGFDENGKLEWCREDRLLDETFERVEKDTIIYSTPASGNKHISIKDGRDASR